MSDKSLTVNTPNCKVYTKNPSVTSNNNNEKNDNNEKQKQSIVQNTEISNEDKNSKIINDKSVPSSVSITKSITKPIKTNLNIKSISFKPIKTIQKPSRKKNCGVCNKRLGFLGFDCKCGKFFCGNHRYYDKHNCTFDYQKISIEKLKKENPKVIPE